MDKSQVWASVGSIAVQTRHDWSEPLFQDEKDGRGQRGSSNSIFLVHWIPVKPAGGCKRN